MAKRKKKRKPRTKAPVRKKKTGASTARITGPRTAAGRRRAKANLKAPWKKGRSGNPRGREPKADFWMSYIDEMSAWPATTRKPRAFKGKVYTTAHAVVYKLLQQATKGNIRAIEILFDRKLGRVPLSIKLPTPPPEIGEGPGLVIKIIDSRTGSPKTQAEALASSRAKAKPKPGPFVSEDFEDAPAE